MCIFLFRTSCRAPWMFWPTRSTSSLASIEHSTAVPPDVVSVNTPVFSVRGLVSPTTGTDVEYDLVDGDNVAVEVHVGRVAYLSIVPPT